MTWDLRRRTEITPVKDSHARIKGLTLTNGHGRYITATLERTPVFVGEWLLHISDIDPRSKNNPPAILHVFL
jgi:hypothetical protein